MIKPRPGGTGFDLTQPMKPKAASIPKCVNSQKFLFSVTKMWRFVLFCSGSMNGVQVRAKLMAGGKRIKDSRAEICMD